MPGLATSLIRRSGAALLDLIYPRYCHGCGKPMPEAGRYLCWDCRAELVLVEPPMCQICGMPVAGYIDHAYTCSACTNHKPVYRQARSAVRLEGVVRDMMLDFKYHDGLWLLNELVTLLQACVETHYDPAMFDAVAYVPLFHAKRRERGYNQAGVLAQELAKRISKPLARRCLYRNRPTRTQTNLTPSQRLSNVRGAFSTRWNRWLSGRRLLLVDDVMTTGATVNACARVLKEGGASAVYVATVARR